MQLAENKQIKSGTISLGGFLWVVNFDDVSSRQRPIRHHSAQITAVGGAAGRLPRQDRATAQLRIAIKLRRDGYDWKPALPKRDASLQPQSLQCSAIYVSFQGEIHDQPT